MGVSLDSLPRAKPDRYHQVSLMILPIAIVSVYLPVYIKLINGPWQTEQEGHGPIIMIAAAWMVWQRRRELQVLQLSPALIPGWALLLFGLAIMFFARTLDILFFDVLSEVPVIAGCVLIYGGWQTLRIVAFPILFLFFSAPPPGWMLDAGTVPLKAFVSDLVAHVLYSLGYPVAQNGVMIMIGSYQLLVKDACAGMNSIFALSAIGVFYSYYISDGSLWRKLALLVAIIPITITANFLRVLALVLIAYYGGIDAVEGPLHEITGILLFVVALLLVFVLDQLLAFSEKVLRRWKNAKARFAN